MDASAYSLLDRLTHRVAFCHPAVQDVLGEIEASVLGARWREQPVARPIFVTSLPRAGTTVLLEVLAGSTALATHTYRDMPFVRAPVLWSRLAGRFRAARGVAERAHGDGLSVGVDSPEAFEEALWLTRFPEQYGPDGIRPWPAPVPVFAAELADHMRRIIVLRRGGVEPGARYLSKNNANIARIAALEAAFPDARIVVPLREPLAHARSMHRQHLRFADLHARDRFARRYMADIGHFEFGALHRPILFEGVSELGRLTGPDRLDYWLGYWLAAFRHLAEQPGLTFLDHAGFCRDGPRNVARLWEWLDLPVDRARAGEPRMRVRPQPPPAPPDEDLPSLADAHELFTALRARSLFGPASGAP